MPILVSDSHFFDYSLDVLIGCFNCPIHLWTIGGGLLMFDLELLTQLCHQLIIQVCTIVGDDTFQRPIPRNDILFDQPSYHVLCYVSKG